MRKIKFRAKSLKGIWIYGTYAYGCFYPDSYKTHRMFPDGEEIEEGTLGEYTGLNDKDGKEIYEGDEIQHNKSKGFIVYKADSFIIDWWHDADSFNQHLRIHNSKIKVIGNIHDNA